MVPQIKVNHPSHAPSLLLISLRLYYSHPKSTHHTSPPKARRKNSLSTLGALVPPYSFTVSIWCCSLDFLKNFEVICAGGAGWRIILLDVRLGVGCWLGEEARGGFVDDPDWDTDESSVFDGWLGEFIGLWLC